MPRASASNKDAALTDLADAINAHLPPPGSPFYAAYAACWTAFCALAACLALRARRRLMPEARAYLRFLAVPWKIAVFAPAFAFVTFAGRYTDDDTWDVVTGGGMAALAFLTAPWSVAVAYRCVHDLRPRSDLVIAAALWLLSSSWSYDAYLTWRDGSYPPMWLPNLCASPLIYGAAGLLWNAEAGPDGGGRLSFLKADWPARPTGGRLRGLALVALPCVAVAATLLVASVGWHM